jgi:plastocyanin
MRRSGHQRAQKAQKFLVIFVPFCGFLLWSFQCLAQQVTVTVRVELSKNNGSRSGDPSGTVVWLTPAAESAQIQAAAGKPRQQLLQRQKTFSPHLLVVPVGSLVDFPNQDPFFHNVFSLFEGKRFDLGLYEAGTSRSVLFNRAGISYIFCNIHPEMSAVVITLKTPYYGIADRKGTITIFDVPRGRYEMEVWNERVLPETLQNLARSVVVAETSTSLGVLRLTEQRNLSQNHRNKYGHAYDSPALGGPAYIRP